VARRAWARISEPGKGPMAVVPVLPVDLHTGAACLVYAHFGRSLRIDGQLMLRRLRPARLFFGNEAYSLVTHLYSVYRPEGSPPI